MLPPTHLPVYLAEVRIKYPRHLQWVQKQVPSLPHRWSTSYLSYSLKAGFNYKSGWSSVSLSTNILNAYLLETWPNDLGKLLKEQNVTLDAVIDSAGGDILSQTSRLMKAGGKLVCYGMWVIIYV
jgi:hypothetical protein